MVSGDASVLNDMDSIVLDSFDLLSVTTESTSHSYAILVPDGCENLSGVTGPHWRSAIRIRRWRM